MLSILFFFLWFPIVLYIGVFLLSPLLLFVFWLVD